MMMQNTTCICVRSYTALLTLTMVQNTIVAEQGSYGLGLSAAD